MADLRSPRPLALEEFIEPSDGLDKSTLLGELHRLLGCVGTNSEAVLNIAVERDLVWDGHALEDVFSLPSLLRWENLVGFW